MNFSRRILIENQDTIHELTARNQELQNEVNGMNDSRDFEDAESVRSGQSHVTIQPSLLPPFPDPGGMLHLIVILEECRAATISRQVFGTRMVYRETFLQIQRRAKHTEYIAITLNEKACLSVSRRRPCPSERSDLFESEQDNLLDQLVRS